MEEAFMVEEINHLYFQDPYNLNELPLEMSITPLKAHQTSSQQTKIMTHIPTGEIIVIIN